MKKNTFFGEPEIFGRSPSDHSKEPSKSSPPLNTNDRSPLLLKKDDEEYVVQKKFFGANDSHISTEDMSASKFERTDSMKGSHKSNNSDSFGIFKNQSYQSPVKNQIKSPVKATNGSNNYNKTMEKIFTPSQYINSKTFATPRALKPGD